jgi:hypothetical protein
VQDKGDIDVNKKAKLVVTKDGYNVVMTEIITLMGNEQENLEDGVQNLPPKPSLECEKESLQTQGQKESGQPKSLILEFKLWFGFQVGQVNWTTPRDITKEDALSRGKENKKQ